MYLKKTVCLFSSFNKITYLSLSLYINIWYRLNLIFHSFVIIRNNEITDAHRAIQQQQRRGEGKNFQHKMKLI